MTIDTTPTMPLSAHTTAQVLTALQDHPDSSMSWIAYKAGVSCSTARTVLETLLRQGIATYIPSVTDRYPHGADLWCLIDTDNSIALS
jgi:DNA-binding IclR family transcriptional regulator